MWHSHSLAVPKGQCQIEDLVCAHWGEEHLKDLDDRSDRHDCRAWSQRNLRTEVKKWPQVLIVHLKRWHIVSLEPFVQEKVDRPVDYERVLSGAGMPLYHLRGIVVHDGEAGSGHYTSVVRAPDNFWYECDDSRPPRRIPVEEALCQQGAMVFFYER